MRSRWTVAVVAATVIVMQPGVAFAHAELEQSSPPSGVLQPAPPAEVRLSFSEQPAADSRVAVLDGCGAPVAGATRVQGRSLSVRVTGGQPGTWRVSYNVVSADDGHPSSGSYQFSVDGSPRCAAESAAPPSPAAAAGVAQGSSSSGVGPLALGLGGVALVVLLGVAVVVRRRAAS